MYMLEGMVKEKTEVTVSKHKCQHSSVLQVTEK